MRAALALALLLAGSSQLAAQTGTDGPQACGRLEGAQRQECIDRLSRLGSQMRAMQGISDDRWVISETTSPVDYTPTVTATIVSQAASGPSRLKLAIHCRRGHTDLELTSDGPDITTASPRDVVVTHSINRDPSVEQRWDARGPVATFKGDAVAFLRSLPDDGELAVRMSDGKSAAQEGRFALTGLNQVRDKLAAACKWPAPGVAPQPPAEDGKGRASKKGKSQ